MARRTGRAQNRSTGGKPRRLPLGWLITGGVILVVAVLVIVVQTGSGKAADFQINAYQGQDVLGGDQVTLHSLLDQGRPIILNFWAGLCPPCRQEMPGFQRLYDARGSEFLMLGVDIGPFVGLGGHQDAINFLRDFQITYPTAWAPTRQPVLDYSVQSMPTTVFLTPDGTIFDRQVGFLSEQDAACKLDRLLAASRTTE